jgi:hypothetical protein
LALEPLATRAEESKAAWASLEGSAPGTLQTLPVPLLPQLRKALLTRLDNDKGVAPLALAVGAEHPA